MKVKEIDRTANVAWSPAAHHPIYLAVGTAAQQLDATFSTTALLEIYALNFSEPGLDMALKGSVVSDFRFHKVVWGCEGMKASNYSGGIIVGGADGGNIMIYDPLKLLNGESAVIHQNTKHTGPIRSLDFNKFQDYLLASGASESEIFVWDLNNPLTPMTPGAKSQPPEDVTCVAWNCQVQHILASTFPARCIVWDLRKNEPIIKVSDSSSRLRCKVIAWHPEVATQLCLASEDDHSPIIQLWDLRFATSPLKTLEHHQRGILSIAWCPQDPDLLLSCGKDNRIVCWNPNSNVENGEVLCELSTSSQWSFDVSWCPRNPAVIANSSCDGHVSVFSLMGGQQQPQCSSKIAESFPGSEMFIQPSHAQSIHRNISVSLKKPPKWLRRPIGATFAFGGKLVSFTNETSTDQSPVRYVHISQIVTEPELLKKSKKLESALTNGNLVEFCQNKIGSMKDEQEKLIWNFLQATFNKTPRAEMLSLLGYDYDKVSSEVNSALATQGVSFKYNGYEPEGSSHKEDGISMGNESQVFGNTVEKIKDDIAILNIEANLNDIDGLISQAILTGNLAYAVDLCIKDKRWADGLVLAQAGGLEILHKTQKLYFKSVTSQLSKLICSVVTSNWASVVQTCSIDCWKEILAAILTYAKPEEFASLCEMLGSRLQDDAKLRVNATLCYISAGNLEKLAQNWTKTHKKVDVVALQDLIEQLMILRRAVEQMSGTSPPVESGVMSYLLGQYGELLTTQGSLSSAATYLIDPNETALAILRDRIYRALGHHSSNYPYQRIDVHPSPQCRTPQQTHQPTLERRQSCTQQQQFTPYAVDGTPMPYSSASSFHQQPPPPVLTPPTSIIQPRFPISGQTPPPSGMMLPPPQSTAMQPPPPSNILQPPSSVPLPPVMMQPVAPSSVMQPLLPTEHVPSVSNAGGTIHHLSLRYPRHLHDPSVYSEDKYSQGGQFYQPPQVTNFPTGRGVIQPPCSFYSSPETNFGNVPYQPSSLGSYTPAPIPPTSPPPPAEPTPIPSCYSDVKPGWNDPPVLKPALPKTVADNYDPNPITAPFPNAVNLDLVQPVSSSGFFVPSFTLQQQQQQPVPQMMNIAPLNTIPQEQKEVQRSIPEQPKEKGPIPPKHQVLQDIFEDLRRQCQQVATNPQMKRKLDDVAKKLENLYDKMREDTLPNQVTKGLHQIVQAVMQSDYAIALTIHGQIVSHANFSQIGGFMPSIKVLLQTAMQLEVFLQ